MNNTSYLVTLIPLIGRAPFTIPDKLCINSFREGLAHYCRCLTKVIAQEQTMTIFREDQSNSIEFSFNSLSKDNHINGNGFTQYYSKKMSSK